MEYLEGFPSFKLTYRRRTGIDDGLSGFADSDWGNSSSRRSTSGNLCLYNRSPILWRSKLQKTTALSTAEAEYYSASTAATEVLYLRNLLERMGFAQPQPTPVYEDNTACLEWVTMSSGDGNVPCIYTSGSTSHTWSFSSSRFMMRSSGSYLV